MKSHRIAIMLPRFSCYGGVEQFGYRLAETLAQRGHVVDFICNRQDAEAPSGVHIRKVRRIGPFKVLKVLSFAILAEKERQRGNYDCAIGLGKTMRQDILRVGGGPTMKYWQCMENAHQGLRRLLLKLRHTVYPHHWLDYCLEKKRYAQRDVRIVAVSHMMCGYAAECFNLERIDVIYNKPDLTRFCPPAAEEKKQAREGYGIAPTVLAIGHAGTNYAIKGTFHLVRALALLPEKYHVYVAGGRKHDALDLLAASLGVSERLHFVGRVNDMPGFLQAMDIFALPTFFDPCSNAVVEALAVGLPTLSSMYNGSSYFLPDDQVMRDPRDVRHMADILLKLGAAAEKNREDGAGPAFAWPQDLPAGVEAFADYVEAYLREKQPALSRIPKNQA